ncbi:MAG TPA: response regulator transcription factor, partial [Armatimonadetes bacterium]|nr:response regulator transcription factor [Armatimonadota bacterium]
LIILDLMLPEMDGWEVCRELRKKGDIPIIMLTARSEEVDRVLGLEMGADDYVVKPFSPRELVARVKAVLRRMEAREERKTSRILRYPGLSIDPVRCEVRVDNQPVALTRKEFDLLWHLASSPGQVFSREKLLAEVWGYEQYFGDMRTVDTHIKRLRQKLQTRPDTPWRIATIWGRGYRFEVR